MKQGLALITGQDSRRMVLSYCGTGKEMIARTLDTQLAEEICYTPDSVADAIDAIGIMYGIDPLNIWELEWLPSAATELQKNTAPTMQRGDGKNG